MARYYQTELKEVLKQISENNITDPNLVFFGKYQLEDEDIPDLIAAFATNHTMNRLDLRNCLIGDEGAKTLARAIAENKIPVCDINLPHNQIGDEGVIALAQAIAENKTLAHIDLSHNRIGNKGAIALAQALASNKSLLTLWLGDNEIHQTGRQAIVDALATNATLISLSYKASYHHREPEKDPKTAEELSINRACFHLVPITAVAPEIFLENFTIDPIIVEKARKKRAIDTRSTVVPKILNAMQHAYTEYIKNDMAFWFDEPRTDEDVENAERLKRDICNASTAPDIIQKLRETLNTKKSEWHSTSFHFQIIKSLIREFGEYGRIPGVKYSYARDYALRYISEVISGIYMSDKAMTPIETLPVTSEQAVPSTIPAIPASSTASSPPLNPNASSFFKAPAAAAQLPVSTIGFSSPQNSDTSSFFKPTSTATATVQLTANTDHTISSKMLNALQNAYSEYMRPENFSLDNENSRGAERMRRVEQIYTKITDADTAQEKAQRLYETLNTRMSSWPETSFQAHILKSLVQEFGKNESLGEIDFDHAKDYALKYFDHAIGHIKPAHKSGGPS